MNSTANVPDLTIVIPTAAVPARAVTLRRAIDSAAAQATADLTVEIVVVANGSRVHDSVLEMLRADPRVRLERRAEGSAPAACRHGRSVARGEFFAFLDDDDEYLPGAMAARLDAIRADPRLDFVVSDGFATTGERLWSRLDVPAARRDPLAALVHTNWVASCGALFRASSVGPDAFAGLPNAVEWTILAFELLASGRRVALVDLPTFRLHDTPGSLSKARDFPLSTVNAIRRMLAHPGAARVRRALQMKLAAAMHEIADLELHEGRWWRAWVWHGRSVVESRSLRYAPFTRHLIVQLLSLGILR